MHEIEIRVRPVVRYIVTRHYKMGNADGSQVGTGTEQLGEFPNAAQANRVAVALHGYEFERFECGKGKPDPHIRLVMAEEG